MQKIVLFLRCLIVAYYLQLTVNTCIIRMKFLLALVDKRGHVLCLFLALNGEETFRIEPLK